MQPLTTVIQMKDPRGNVTGEKEVATYAGLLSLAHEEGLESIATVLVQVPTSENGMMAICAATVKTKRGAFMGVGDASPENVNRKIAPHIIRMAETRAKARALRDAVNIGIVCLEELGGAEGEVDALPEPGDDRNDRRDNRGRDNVRDIREREGRRDDRGNERGDRRGDVRQQQANPRSDLMSENQRRFLLRMLAEDQGIEGDAAVDAICRGARVDRIGDITKQQASNLIDSWAQGRQRA